ncbi:MAG: hypothetical protein AAGE76_03560 [Pseudomonadota bacterium]
MAVSTPPGAFSGAQIFRAALNLWLGNLFVLTAISFLFGLFLLTVSSVLQLGLGVSGLALEFMLGPIGSGLLVLVAADLLAEEPIDPAALSRRITAVIGPLIILSIVGTLLTAMGFFLLVLPGLYVAAVLLPLVPVILMEHQGWQSLGHTWQMAQPHAWPLVGVLLRLLAVGIVLLVPILLIVSLDGFENLQILSAGLTLAGSALLSGLAASVSVLTYYGLRGGDDNVSEVFE